MNIGIRGYDYLRQTGYPLPTARTLTGRMEKFSVSSGVLTNLLDPLKHKVQCMDPMDRFCSMSIDEMQIKSCEDYDRNLKEYVGFISLGDMDELSTHLMVILIRGLRNPWKQVIAVEITGGSVSGSLMAEFVHKSIQFAENAGLYVVSLTSDMGNNNTRLWKHLDLYAKKDGSRKNTFISNGHSVHVIPDTCHLIKNLRNAMHCQNLVIPEDVRQYYNLPSRVISGKYISTLWEAETKADKPIRSLYHLSSEDVCTEGFEKMHVGLAMRYLSEKTSAAIELAVNLKLLPEAAKTTVWFIRLIHNWFELVSSRHRKTSITSRNKGRKLQLLQEVIQGVSKSFTHPWQIDRSHQDKQKKSSSHIA